MRAPELDFSLLDEKPRLKPLAPLQRIRDSHHWVARSLAMGRRHIEVAAETGYSISRISILLADPTFQELIAIYRQELAKRDLDGHMEERDMMHINYRKALRLQSDYLDDVAEAAEAGERIPGGAILDNVVNLADRLGHGKTQTNVNVDGNGLAERIEAARRAYLRSLAPSGGDPDVSSRVITEHDCTAAPGSSPTPLLESPPGDQPDEGQS